MNPREDKELMKTYEVYENGKRYGVLKWYKETMKKVLAVSVSAVISVSTITGCSFKGKTVDPDEPTYTTTTIEYDSLDSEIQDKMHFVDQVMLSIKDKHKNDYYKLESTYQNAKKIEYDLEPQHIRDYGMTQKDFKEKEKELLSYLDSLITYIENKLGYKFGEDFIQYENTNNFDTKEEEMERKEHFVINVMNDLKEIQVYEIYGKIMQYYEKYIIIKDNINAENLKLDTTIINEEQRNDTLLDLLNKMIRVIENETDYRFGVHFLEPVYGKK